MFSRLFKAAVVLAFLFAFSGIVSAQQKGHEGMAKMTKPDSGFVKAMAVLNPTEGNNVHGTVAFMQVKEGVQVIAKIEGLTPGKHGFHIHEYGDCTAPDGNSAGGHYNPSMASHGDPKTKERHAGDIGNIEADSSGVASLEWIDPVMKLDGPNSIVGRGVIVHEKEDDLKTQPTGNAGGRVACGVIGIVK